MKYTSIFCAVLLSLYTSASYATNYPKETQSTQQHQTSVSNGTATAGANSGSTSGSNASSQSSSGSSSANAGGGNSTSGAIADSSASNNANVNSQGGQVSSRMWVLPSPVFSIPAPIACPQGVASSNAFAIGWNFISIANSSSNGDNCLAIAIRNAKVETCQFYDAAQIENLLAKKVLPDFEASTNVQVNLSPEACSILKTPLTEKIRYETAVPNTTAPAQTTVVNVYYNEEQTTQIKAPKRAPKQNPKCKEDEVAICVKKENTQAPVIR